MSGSVSSPLVELEPLSRAATGLGVALHSVEVTVDGEPVVNAAVAGLGVHAPHRMYSVSKTVTGFAVGLLADEGRLSLDDPITSHFPEFGSCHPWVEATTLRHMLSMLGPHAATTYKLFEGGWLESYFTVPPTHPPGAVFTYDTSASYVLAALVERVAGTSLVDYLRPRLLDPLGASNQVRFLTGPEPISHGGSGLICTPRDLLLLAHLMLDDGILHGAHLLPAGYLRAATTVQADTAMLTWDSPFRGGYGYQLWLPPRGGFLMFGLGGQIVYGDPAHRLAAVVTADTQPVQGGDQRLVDLVLRHLVDPIVEQSAGRPPTSPASPGPTEQTELAWPLPAHDAAHAVPTTGPFTSCSDDGWPGDLELDGTADGGTVRSPSGDWMLKLACGTPMPQVFGPAARPAVVTAGWAAPRTLDVVCWVVDDELAVVRLRLHVGPDGTLTARGQGFGETFDPRWTFCGAYRTGPVTP